MLNEATMTTWVCRSDRFTRSADTFSDVSEFLAMCIACFGEKPDLRQDADGNYRLPDGELVLEICDDA